MTHTDEVAYLPLLIGCGAMLLVATAAIFAFAAKPPPAIDPASIVVASDRGAALQDRNKRIRVKCAECGVVASTREVGLSAAETDPGVRRATSREPSVAPMPNREVTVRMQDGSSRVFVAANSVRWRPGERVVLIEGASRIVE